MPPGAEAVRSPLSGTHRWRPLWVGSPAELRAIRRALVERAGVLRRTPAERATALGDVCRRWADPSNAFRVAILRSLVEEGGFAPRTAAAGLDASLRAWTPSSWTELARRELNGRPARPIGVVPMVLGSALPGPNVLSPFFALLAGGAALVRPGRHVPRLPALALASLAAIDPDLAACAAVVRWPRERADLTRTLFEGAPVASATGSDEAVGAIRSLLAPGTRLLAHPHRVSFAYVGASAAADLPRAGETARLLARDIALHDQLGCLSPVGVLVEQGTPGAPAVIAGALARELARLEREWPRSTPSPAEALAIRSFHDVLALPANDGFALPGNGSEWGAPLGTEGDGLRRGARVAAGEGLAWVVGLLSATEPVPAPPLFRCVWVGAVGPGSEPVHRLEAWRAATAAIGFRGSLEELARARRLARELSARRVCALGRMQSPPLWWRPDGIHPVRDLLR